MLRNILRVALAATAALGGCASPQPQEPTEIYESVTAPRQNAPLSARDIYPPHATKHRYQIVEGEQAGEEIAIVTEKTTRFDADWVRRENRRRLQFWRFDEQGNAVMTAAIEHERDARTYFDPPLIIAYKSMSKGESQEQKVKMRVVSEKDPNHEMQTGTVTQTIKYVEDVKAKVPAGFFDARKVIVRFEADLTLAEAGDVTTLYIAPDIGIVAEQRNESVRYVGVIEQDTQRLLELVETCDSSYNTE